MALINSCANLPNIFTSYLYKAPPRYLNAFLVNLAAAGVAIAFATLLRLYLRRQNAKLERGEAMPKSGPTEAQQAQGFRYPL
jgi:NADH:ubiquinone oxidoreductase subunit K